jgi:O-antigen/teichoic acid export membrane protein
MAGLARQALVLTLSRIANYGLMIISPVILVRLLTVAEFGHYREFLLYANILQTVATLSINDSLLYFIPAHPRSRWRVVSHTAGLTLVISSAVTAGFLGLNWLLDGRLVGAYAVPLALYVMFYVNLDFWECYWLALNRPSRVFAYTVARLLMRMLVVIGAGMLTADVTTIIWSLVVFEAIRLAASLTVWRISSRARAEPPVENIRREQLRFCVPAGLGAVCYMVSRNLGSVAVARYLGAAALAQLTIGTYGEPIIFALRNSISAVVLPELVRRNVRASDAPLRLWQRMTVVNCVLLMPAAVLVALFAQPLILTAFGGAYRGAIPVLQLYSLVIIRSCFDFAPPLRAINRTRPLLDSTFAAALASAATLTVLLPVLGVVGAACALVVSNLVEGLYLARSVQRLYGVTLANLLPWKAVASVAACAVAASLPILAVPGHAEMGLIGAAFWSAGYAIVFWLLLMLLRVEEAVDLTRRLKSTLASVA